MVQNRKIYLELIIQVGVLKKGQGQDRERGTAHIPGSGASVGLALRRQAGSSSKVDRVEGKVTRQ